MTESVALSSTVTTMRMFAAGSDIPNPKAQTPPGFEFVDSIFMAVWWLAVTACIAAIAFVVAQTARGYRESGGGVVTGPYGWLLVTSGIVLTGLLFVRIVI